MTTGKDLLDLGFKSGKWVKDALAHRNDHALEGEAQLSLPNAVGLACAPAGGPAPA